MDMNECLHGRNNCTHSLFILFSFLQHVVSLPVSLTSIFLVVYVVATSRRNQWSCRAGWEGRWSEERPNEWREGVWCSVKGGYSKIGAAVAHAAWMGTPRLCSVPEDLCNNMLCCLRSVGNWCDCISSYRAFFHLCRCVCRLKKREKKKKRPEKKKKTTTKRFRNNFFCRQNTNTP